MSMDWDYCEKWCMRPALSPFRDLSETALDMPGAAATLPFPQNRPPITRP
jgi:hypothetical protein